MDNCTLTQHSKQAPFRAVQLQLRVLPSAWLPVWPRLSTLGTCWIHRPTLGHVECAGADTLQSPFAAQYKLNRLFTCVAQIFYVSCTIPFNYQCWKMENGVLQKTPLMSVIHEEWECFELGLWLNKMAKYSKWGRTKGRLSAGNFCFLF